MNYGPFGRVAAFAQRAHFQSVISAMGTALHGRQMFIALRPLQAGYLSRNARLNTSPALLN